MEQKRKIAAALTAAAIMTAIGAGAAEAQTQPKAGNTAQVNAQSNPVEPKPKPKYCSDTDSAGSERSSSYATYHSVLCDGKVYVLTINAATATPVGGWQPVGGPADVIDVSLASNSDDVDGGPVFVTVLTKKGKVWKGTCPSALPLGLCTWAQLPNPPQ